MPNLAATHPVLGHKFISFFQVLDVYRELQRSTREPSVILLQKVIEKIQNLGTRILLSNRFPAHELYYDLNESLLGLVFDDIVEFHNKAVDAVYDTSKWQTQLFQILNMQTTEDPFRGVYTRDSFEKWYKLSWHRKAHCYYTDVAVRPMVPIPRKSEV